VHKSGFREYRWHDSARERPVWVDVWYPAAADNAERPIIYGLGAGSAALDAPLDSSDAPLPLIVMSHGAFGAARDYGWIGEYLARRGFVVAGVSHFGESWIYGPDTIESAAVTRLWVRPQDCSLAIDRILEHDDFDGHVDAARIGAIGHSSGGSTAIALGGATFDAAALAAYCQTAAAAADLGCKYGGESQDVVASAAAGASGSYRDARIRAIVALDPAVGPGYSAASLAAVRVPVFVVGSAQNDFLPFWNHAGHYAVNLPQATLLKLDAGEGHFVYLNCGTSELAANGIPLFIDRTGVDREGVHARLAPAIAYFLVTALNPSA
jgi:predicted dienelactone hydrolase